MTRQLVAKVHVNPYPAAAGEGGPEIRPQVRASVRLDKRAATGPQVTVRSLAWQSAYRDKWPLTEAGLRGDKWPITKSDIGHEKCSILLVRSALGARSHSDKWPVSADKWPLSGDELSVRADKWPRRADKWPLSADKWPLS